MQNELKISVPEGFEIDKNNSTYELIKFKPIKKKDFREIKTFEDACIELNINPDSINNSVNVINRFTKPIIANYKLMIIAEAINQGWTPDWNNSNQRKYFPYFNLSSGFGFGDSGYYCVYSITSVGSRLCFETEEKSTYTGKQFIDIYKDYLK